MNMNYGCAVYVNTITDRSRELRVLKLDTITSEVVGWVVKNRACLSPLHVSSLACFLDLTARELSRGVGVGRIEAIVFLLWQTCKVESGFSAAGISSTKCRLQTLESLLGIQRVPFKLFLLNLLIFLPIVIGSLGSTTFLVVAAHFLSLCPLLGQSRITLFR